MGASTVVILLHNAPQGERERGNREGREEKKGKKWGLSGRSDGRDRSMERERSVSKQRACPNCNEDSETGEVRFSTARREDGDKMQGTGVRPTPDFSPSQGKRGKT